jgi:hypothetical protein
MISIKIENLDQVKAELKDMPQKINTVLSRAVNRAVTNAKKNMSIEARKRYAVVKSGDIKASINDTKATPQHPFATIASKGKKIDLIDFKLTPKNLFKGQNGYKVQVLQSGGTKIVPGFAASTKGNWGLFKRDGSARYPMSRLMGPAVPQMIENKEVIGAIEREAQAMLNKRITAEIAQALRMQTK